MGFEKIQPENFDELETELYERLPKSIRLFNTLKIIRQNLLPTDNFSTVFYSFQNIIYISLQHFINYEGGAYILISQPNTKLSENLWQQFVFEFEEFLESFTSFHIGIEDFEEFLTFIKNIETKYKNKGRNPKVSIHQTWAYNYPLKKLSATLLSAAQELLEVRTLQSESDTAIVNQNWSLGTEATKRFIKISLDCLPSAGVFVSGIVRSWALTSIYGSINALGTHVNYRGRGYAKNVIKHIVQSQLAIGLLPTARVVRENIVSINLCESIGFKREAYGSNWIDLSY